MLSRVARSIAFNRAASTLVLAEVNGAGELQGMTHMYDVIIKIYLQLQPFHQ